MTKIQDQLWDLEISVRAFNVFCRFADHHNIDDIHNLVKITDDEFLRFRKIGKKTLAEFREATKDMDSHTEPMDSHTEPKDSHIEPDAPKTQETEKPMTWKSKGWKAVKKTDDRVMVFFVCDREKCDHCNPECHHTLSLYHAKYEEHTEFEPDSHGNLWEVKRKDE